MKKFTLLLLLLTPYIAISQELNSYDKPPVFSDCEAMDIEGLQNCFNNKIYSHIFNTFKVPENVTEENYNGEVVVLFEVNKEGEFSVIYADAMYDELKDEATRVFSELPKIKPGTYNGKPAYKQYSMSIMIPLVNQTTTITKSLTQEEKDAAIEEAVKIEYDSVNVGLVPYTNKEFTSQLNIPFTHSMYAKFDRNINLVGANSHTASKPYLYEDVSKYYDFQSRLILLVKLLCK